MNKNLQYFSIALVVSFLYGWGLNISQKEMENFFYAKVSEPIQQIELIKMPLRPKKPELEIKTESAISVKINKAGREKIVFKKNPLKALPIASLTKLMTSLIVLENTNDYNLSKVTTVSEAAANQEDVPVYGNLKTGESFTIEKLLELMLIYSSNDAAFTLSEVIGGEEFIDKMNLKAESLGLENTHFTNPTGLDPEESDLLPNYSSAQDLAELSKYILKKYPLIFEISLKPGPYPTYNGISNLYLLDSQDFIGGKTGYTEKAGGCMLSVLQDEKDSTFINIVLGADSSEERIPEMQRLINWISL
jgi:D-alanyl-D-alanine carboxypeptidase (penicillin-binding protein 5/6)